MSTDLDDYWTRIRERANELGSDGCSGVPDFYLDGCLEHDLHYRTHRRLDGIPITRAEADAQFRRYMQRWSTFGVLSPMAWWRWLGVRAFGRFAWDMELGSPSPNPLETP